jgi:hypothetical protein
MPAAADPTAGSPIVGVLCYDPANSILMRRAFWMLQGGKIFRLTAGQVPPCARTAAEVCTISTILPPATVQSWTAAGDTAFSFHRGCIDAEIARKFTTGH